VTFFNNRSYINVALLVVVYLTNTAKSISLFVFIYDIIDVVDCKISSTMLDFVIIFVILFDNIIN